MEENKSNINWYPGHMVKAQREIKDSLKLIDVVVEILDARIPNSSVNPLVEKLVQGKKRIVVLNKIDLADTKKIEKWENKFKEEGKSVIRVDATKGTGIKNIVSEIQKLGKEVYDAKNKKIPNPIFRALIIGIPNVGKSTIINKMANKNAAKVGNKPGVTVKKQWIRLTNNVELLDTPGILWPNLEDKKAGVNLALTGNIKQEILDLEELAVEGIKKIKAEPEYLQMLKEKYKLEEDLLEVMDYDIIELIGRKRGCLISGGRVDMLKASKIFLDELKAGKIGRISFE